MAQNIVQRAMPTVAKYPIDIYSYRTISNLSDPSKGAVMRRSDGGVGCGARGLASQARTREAPGPDRAALRPLCRVPAGLGQAAPANNREATSQEARTRGRKSPRWSAGW